MHSYSKLNRWVYNILPDLLLLPLPMSTSKFFLLASMVPSCHIEREMFNATSSTLF
jgi:hypothetical protein